MSDLSMNLSWRARLPTRPNPRAEAHERGWRASPRDPIFLLCIASVALWISSLALVSSAGASPEWTRSRDTPKMDPLFGLEKREPWTTSRVIGSPEPPAPYVVKPVFPKLKKFSEPLELVAMPGSERFLVIE